MSSIKKYLGIVWIVLALLIAYFNIIELGLPKLQSGKQEDLVFGIINLFILTPIVVGGLITFGVYALKGEYKDS